MRVVVHGQRAFGKAVLERLLDRGDDVVAVCSAPESDGREDELVALAREAGLPVHLPASWRTPEALELMASLEADICMMAYVLLPVPVPVLNAPRFGTFQYHPSLLPRHRGPSSINWAISVGDTRTGLTIFWPNEGLDQGPILLQKTCEIGPSETVGDLYFKKLFPMGVDAMIESLDLVKAGVLLKHEQDLEAGSYESWFDKSIAELDWNQQIADVFAKIRAADPAPGAWGTIKGKRVDIFDATLIDGQGKPGEVLAISGEGVVIAGHGGAVLVGRMRGERDEKKPAGKLATELGISVGDVFSVQVVA